MVAKNFTIIRFRGFKPTFLMDNLTFLYKNNNKLHALESLIKKGIFPFPIRAG